MSLEVQQIRELPVEKRYTYLLKNVIENNRIWILTDEHGCVMLNTDDEDCVPVWPSEAFAQDWATGEWANCTPKAIELEAWHQRWTNGLEEDGVEVVVFPNPDEDGLVISPDEFDHELRQRSQTQ